MTDFLSDLPREILVMIVREICGREFCFCQGHHALWQWSRTSVFFRNLIAPYIFDIVELCCQEDQSGWVNDIASGPYGHLIKKIHFYANIDECDDIGELSNPAEILPQSVGRLLSNLHLFPSLDLLSIEFLGRTYQEQMDTFTDEESDVQVRNAEEREGWRALMASIYEALAKNEKSYAKGLELRNVLFKRTSTFASPSFHNFLSHLETFSLSIEVKNFPERWAPNVCPEYIAFGSKLDIIFFDHLSNLTSLTIKAPEKGPIGIRYHLDVPLALRKDHMPRLKYVHLEYIVACPEMIDFLVSHTATLEHISLRDCIICQPICDCEANNDFCWGDFFDKLCDAGFSNLRQFELLPVDPPFTWTENMSWGRDLPILRDPGPGRRLFAYMYVEYDYGHVHLDSEITHASLERGQDQISYDRLMRMVDANATKSHSRTPLARVG